jgi:hypothetical protein
LVEERGSKRLSNGDSESSERLFIPVIRTMWRGNGLLQQVLWGRGPEKAISDVRFIPQTMVEYLGRFKRREERVTAVARKLLVTI